MRFAPWPRRSRASPPSRTASTTVPRASQGFTHVYLLTFKDAAARDAYLPHPEHKKFGQVLGKSGIFVDAFVVDYTPTTTR